MAWTPIHLSSDVPLPKGPYSPAVRAGDFVFASGQVPRDPLTGVLAGSDVATQTRQTLSNLQRVLEQADDWGAMNAVYTEAFQAPFPSRTTVGAELRGILVEISAVAYVQRPS